MSGHSRYLILITDITTIFFGETGVRRRHGPGREGEEERFLYHEFFRAHRDAILIVAGGYR